MDASAPPAAAAAAAAAAPPLSVSIPSYADSDNYTSYTVMTSKDGTNFAAHHRYSDFVKLHAELRESFPFPCAKKYFHGTGVKDERREKFEAMLNQIIGLHASGTLPSALVHFLRVDDDDAAVEAERLRGELKKAKLALSWTRGVAHEAVAATQFEPPEAPGTAERPGGRRGSRISTEEDATQQSGAGATTAKMRVDALRRTAAERGEALSAEEEARAEAEEAAGLKLQTKEEELSKLKEIIGKMQEKNVELEKQLKVETTKVTEAEAKVVDKDGRISKLEKEVKKAISTINRQIRSIQGDVEDEDEDEDEMVVTDLSTKLGELDDAMQGQIEGKDQRIEELEREAADDRIEELEGEIQKKAKRISELEKGVKKAISTIDRKIRSIQGEELEDEEEEEEEEEDEEVNVTDLSTKLGELDSAMRDNMYSQEDLDFETGPKDDRIKELTKEVKKAISTIDRKIRSIQGEELEDEEEDEEEDEDEDEMDVTDLSTKLGELDDAMQELMYTEDQLEDRIRPKDQRIEDLEGEAGEKDDRIVELEGEIEANSKRAGSQVKAMANRISALESEMADKDSEIERKDDEIVELQGEIEKKAKRISKLERENSDLESRLHQAGITISSLQQDKERLTGQVQDLTRRLQQAEQDKERLAGQVRDLTRRLQQAEQDKERLSDQVQNSAPITRLQQAQRDLQQVQQAKERLEGQVREISRRLQQAEQEKAQLEGQVQDLIRRLQQAERPVYHPPAPRPRSPPRPHFNYTLTQCGNCGSGDLDGRGSNQHVRKRRCKSCGQRWEI